MVNCKWCGTPTSAEFTQECDRCWELHWRIEDNPQVALQMLAQLTSRAVDLPNAPACDCGSVAGIHCDFCAVENTANH